MSLLHLKIKLLLVMGLFGLLLTSFAQANDIAWFKKGDPLNTMLEMPPALADLGDGGVAGTCEPLNLQANLSLADVAQAAMCNNPQTREAYLNAKVQAAQVGIAKAAFLPTLTNQVGLNQNLSIPESVSRGGFYHNLSNNLAASYLLYDFGNRNANLENARQLLQAASATQNATVQSVLLAAVKAYYQAQAAISVLEAANEAEKAAEEGFKAAEAKYKSGAATPADKLQAQTAFAQASLTRITAEGTLRTAYGTLANVMGMDANVPLKLQETEEHIITPDFTQDIDELIKTAQQQRPDILASEAQLRAAMVTIEANKAAAKPTVSLSTSNAYLDGNSLTANNTSSLGVSVTIPLFNGYAPTYRIRSAEAVAEVRAAQRDKLKLQISLDVWTAYQSLRTSTEAVRLADALVNSAKESYRMALGRYKAGVGNNIDVLQAQSSLANANLQKIQAMLNWNIARASLAQAIGALDNAMIQSLPEGSHASANQELQP